MATKFYELSTNKTYNVSMREWDGTQYGPDMTGDLLGGEYHYDELVEAYVIDDIRTLTELLEDWSNGNDDDTRSSMQDLLDQYGAPDSDNEYSDDPANGYLGRHPVASARESIANRDYDVEEVEDATSRIYTRDGHAIRTGDWLSDTEGCYEVTEIDSYHVYLREVMFRKYDPEAYDYGDTRRLTHKEIRYLSYN